MSSPTLHILCVICELSRFPDTAILSQFRGQVCEGVERLERGCA
jgi:hypothetical protein